MKKTTIVFLMMFTCIITAKSQEFGQTFNKVQVYDSISKSYSKQPIDQDVFNLINLEQHKMTLGAFSNSKVTYLIEKIMLPKDTLIMYCVNATTKKQAIFKMYRESNSTRVMECYVSKKDKTKYIAIVVPNTEIIKKINAK
jgi:hypothetical protein